MFVGNSILCGRPVCDAGAAGQAGSARTGGAVRLGSPCIPRDDAHKPATAGGYDFRRSPADRFWPLPQPPPADDVAGTHDYLRITQVLRYSWELTVVVLDGGVAYASKHQRCVLCAAATARQNGWDLEVIDCQGAAFHLGLTVANLCQRKSNMGTRRCRAGAGNCFYGYDICERTHGLGEQSQMVLSKQGADAAL